MVNNINPAVCVYTSVFSAPVSKTERKIFNGRPVEEIKAALKAEDFSSPADLSLSASDRIVSVQEALISLGLLSIEGNRNSKGEPDGKPGIRTFSAVKELRLIAGSTETFEGITENDVGCILEILSYGRAETPAASEVPAPAVPPVGVSEKIQGLSIAAPLGFSLARNEEVAVVQEALIDQGYLELRGNQDANGKPDGKAGNRTFEGIFRLRADNGINDPEKLIKQSDIDLLLGKKDNADVASAVEAPSPPDAKEAQLPADNAVEDRKNVRLQENPLEQEISGYVMDADKALRYIDSPSLVLSTVSGKFVIDPSRPLGERSVILMARETYLADYYLNTGDLQKALNVYAKISRMFTRPSRGRIVNIGDLPGREVEMLAERYLRNAYSQSVKIVQTINEAYSQKDISDDA